ncbi:MAG: hypothetical protein JST54_30880 [Deltaproteobacteria bacterium]|nr:hypothetical protein [Deltaproteobacteria bacterium]
MTKPRRPWRYVLLAFAVSGAIFMLTRPVCWSAWLLHGVMARQCPDGDFRQTLWANANGIHRGGEGWVYAGAVAHYAVARSQYDRTGVVRRVTADVSLVDAKGNATPLESAKAWINDDGTLRAPFKFPNVPDGDYQLRVHERTSLGEGSVDVPLALYAPAKVHVITDRPLYQPGDVIKFRAVALRARDLVPLDGRPGHWEVRDPNGELVLEEKANAGQWGVVAGTFPLDSGAPQGEWHVAWVSGDARDDVSIKVQPFVLPRFRVEANATKPFYRAHEKPEVKGRVVYSSGAPVAGATLEISWNVGGNWPPPTDWLTKTLPQHATADKDGTFDLKLPEIPGDLQGQAPLVARIAATDASGDRVEGSASALLSEDAIQVSTVTELADGLVEGFNNRLFLRASTASGAVLPGVELLVKRAWDSEDPGVKAMTDEDGVAQLQIDPGSPVNVVIPPPPYRPPPPQPAVSLQETEDLLRDDEVPLVDQEAIERIVPELALCARFANGGADAQVGLEIDSSGAIRGHGANFDSLSDCAAAALASKRLPAGKPRLYRLDLDFSDHALAQVGVSAEGVPGSPDVLQQALTVAVDNARSCLPRRTASGGSVELIGTWHSAKAAKLGTVTWSAEGEGKSLQPCLQSKAATFALPKENLQDYVGVVKAEISPSEEDEVSQPQATTMLGYELRITARQKGKEIGATTIRIKPGNVPPLRLRATPVLASAGGPLDIELLRGPNYEGDVPEEAYLLSDRGGDPVKVKVDREARTAHFQLPPNAAGWFTVSAGGAQALVYVRSQQALAVALKTERERYAPGQKAKLAVRTMVGGTGTQAAVGLFGVDESLAQLVSLPGPDDMARVHQKVQMTSPAFGTLDGEALTLGRIRGANAAMATVLRVNAMPTAAELDGVFAGNSATTFDPNGELTDRFYDILGELHAQAREWEASAPQGEKMHPPGMAALWRKALDAVEARHGNVKDAYGRRLRLSQLPSDLLALTDPRQVIIQGTRLPEDVESWSAYVAKEKP